MATILVADDSAGRRRIISSVLERAGFETVIAADGLAAVQSVFRDRPDAVILDVRLPQLSAYVVTRLLKDDPATAGLPVVIITSRDGSSDRYWGEQTGADRVLDNDFGAQDVVSAVRGALATADEMRQGRPRAAAVAVELEDADVLARVSELLDRKLFEAKVSADVTAIAANVNGFEATLAAVLELLARILDHDLAAVCLLDTRVTYLTVARDASHRHYRDFCAAIADTAGNLLGHPVMPTDLVPRVADPQGLLRADQDDEMGTFLSLPLRARGRLIGCLAVSSTDADAFGDAARDILRLIEQPAAVVISNARLAEEHPAAHVA